MSPSTPDATQIIYLALKSPSTANEIKKPTTDSHQTFNGALRFLATTASFESLYWGCSVEQPTKLQIHVLRSTQKAHDNFISSTLWKNFLALIQNIINPDIKPFVRHCAMSTLWTSPHTAFTAPVTGTAIYLHTLAAWHEGSWPCWTHVVRHVKGCAGISGGPLLEPLVLKKTVQEAQNAEPDTESIEDCYLVYVGWDSIAAHREYHHTEHFAEHKVILGIGNKGWREYGHIKFESWIGKDDRDQRGIQEKANL